MAGSSQQNAGSHPWRQTWQTDSDVGMRRMIVEKILQLFQKQKPQVSPEWRQKLPDFVRRLEESLYRDASSKEEYSDLLTLEHRLQAVARRITPVRNNAAYAARGGMNMSASSMIPTPGVPSTFKGSTMIPTPGSEMTVVPTPGLGTSGTTSGVPLQRGVGIASGPNIDMPRILPSQRHQSGDHMYHNLNGQLGGSSMQQKGPMPYKFVNGGSSNGFQSMSNEQHLANSGTPGFSGSNLLTSAVQFSTTATPSVSQQLKNHQRSGLHGITLGDRYAGNVADISGQAGFYNASTPGFSGSNPGFSRMIPVPGLAPQQSQAQGGLELGSSRAEQKPSFFGPSVEPCGKIDINAAMQQELQAPGVSKLVNHQRSSHLQHASNVQQVQHGFTEQGEASIRISRQLPTQGEQNDTLSLMHPQNMDDNHLSESIVQHSEQKNMHLLDDSHKSHQAASGSGIGVKPTNAFSASNPVSDSSTNTEQKYLKQQRWLLFLRHASKCTVPEGQCQTNCHMAKQLWAHIIKCRERDCQFPRCQPSRTLIRHHHFCRDAQCPVCGPVRQKCHLQRMAQVQATSAPVGLPSPPPRGIEVSVSGLTDAEPSRAVDFQPPPAKRPKVESYEQGDGNIKIEASSTIPSQFQEEPLAEPAVVKVEHNSVTGKVEEANRSVMKPELPGDVCMPQAIHSTQIEPETKLVHMPSSQVADSSIHVNKAALQAKQEVKQELVSVDNATNSKSSKPKIKGVSLTELFTPEQIREQIFSLRQWVGQSKAKAEKNQAMESRMTENSCQLCAVETLTFEPPPIYCTSCGARIKRNVLFWTMQSGETRHYFCVPCYNDARSDTVEIDGAHHPKSKLEKRRNDEETEEPWVQCDNCEKWQHQICALFNLRRNEGGQAEYTCPHCLMGEIERGERKPLPQSAVLGAKDLPRTILSDHIEQRLGRRLKHERHERARAQGKSYEEVPGAESLVVRIVSSVDKKLEVKPHFLELFQEENYPTEYLYKSKVILLFQKIEGVEVCLFGMYVQEFGVEADQPNQRRVYLSYLDSVKYFRPDVRTIHGEALRTFVYHEILIGYLDYCKKRGFTSCYIWACPPLKGEDYILYCHPEIQKTPRSDKLREWYLTMLRKAASENIVMEVTNMYDHFFVCTGESKAKVTATRLPYFDGDYWPGAAEDMITQLEEEEIGQRQQKKGKAKKAATTKRATKLGTQPDMSSNTSKDLQLMHKLGESIFPMKEDFIMVHLQYACKHCCNFILSGCQWNCKQCKNFYICDSCYEAEQKLDDRDRHPVNSKEAHAFFPVELLDPLPDTKDKDEITESEFFDTRQAFLSLCQGNHYQYDTLRRAKHSSMMVLYHLHNPTAPAYVTTCNSCHRDIETGQGWHCETCPDFDLCSTCYSEDLVKHPHKLSPHPSVAERESQSKEARQQRVLQLRKMLDLLVHASQCGSVQCQYPNCRRVKGLFRHGMVCKTRASGGCHLCKKMWYLLQLHARACKESECRVPRCRDLKEHLRRLQQQMESRRRAAVKEMMRQRTAEVAADTS